MFVKMAAYPLYHGPIGREPFVRLQEEKYLLPVPYLDPLYDNKTFLMSSMVRGQGS